MWLVRKDTKSSLPFPFAAYITEKCRGVVRSEWEKEEEEEEEGEDVNEEVEEGKWAWVGGKAWHAEGKQ